MLFPNSYHNVDHQHFSFVVNINFENYLWGVDVYEEILGELDRWKEKLNEIRTSISKDGRESKSKAV